MDEHRGLDPRPFRRLELERQADPRRRPREVPATATPCASSRGSAPGSSRSRAGRAGRPAGSARRPSTHSGSEVVVDLLPHEPAHVEAAAVDLDHRLGPDRADLARAGHQVVERHRGGVRRQADRAAQEAVREGEPTGRRPRPRRRRGTARGRSASRGPPPPRGAKRSRAGRRRGRAVPLLTPRSPPRGSSRGRRPRGRGGRRTPRGPARGSGC